MEIAIMKFLENASQWDKNLHDGILFIWIIA